jgi:TolB protein
MALVPASAQTEDDDFAAYDESQVMSGADAGDAKAEKKEKKKKKNKKLKATGVIVFSSNRDGNYEIYTMDAKGKQVLRRTADLPNQYAPIDTEPTVSRNGEKIAWVSTRRLATDIWIMDVTGANQTRLTVAAANTYNISPAFSPDGSKIAFVSNRTGVPHIYVMNADGSNQVQLTTGDNSQQASAPVFSPDGTQIAFATGAPGNIRLGLMNADGTGRKLILDKSGAPINGTNPAFSHDGHSIVFNTPIESGTTSSVIRVVSDTGDVVTLTPVQQGIFNAMPVYSPDGKSIAYTSGVGGNGEIILMRADGTSPVNITNAAGSDEYASWGMEPANR